MTGKKWFTALYTLFWGTLFLGASISILRCTAVQGTDFAVFWNAARTALHGEPLYSLSRDGGMIFKYPPWLLPFFLPFGFFSLETSKWIWGIIEVGSIVSIVLWLRREMSVNLTTCFVVLSFFWGLWIVHALDGQCSLPMLAITLASWSPRLRFDLKSFAFVTALSAKIFTIFPLISLRWTLRSWLALTAIITVLLSLSIPAVMNQPDKSPVSLFLDWKAAATSAGKLLGTAGVRGPRNAGLSGYVLRVLEVPAENSRADVTVALAFCLLLGLAWWKLSRGLQEREQALGWLALVPVVHPLPWWHLFVFSFPLAVVVIDRSLKKGDRVSQLLAILGLFLITLSTEKIWGHFGIFLEMNAAKSWGVLCCLGSIWILERPRNRVSLPGPFQSSLEYLPHP